MTNSKYRVSVDGQVLNTDEYGEWIESSTPLTDNIITDLYMGFIRSLVSKYAF